MKNKQGRPTSLDIKKLLHSVLDVDSEFKKDQSEVEEFLRGDKPDVKKLLELMPPWAYLYELKLTRPSSPAGD